MLYKVVLTFEHEDGILKCDQLLSRVTKVTTCVDLRWKAKRSRKLTRKYTQVWSRAIWLVIAFLIVLTCDCFAMAKRSKTCAYLRTICCRSKWSQLNASHRKHTQLLHNGVEVIASNLLAVTCVPVRHLLLRNSMPFCCVNSCSHESPSYKIVNLCTRGTGSVHQYTFMKRVYTKCDGWYRKCAKYSRTGSVMFLHR